MTMVGIIPFPLGEAEKRVKLAMQILQEAGSKLLQFQKEYFEKKNSVKERCDSQNIIKVCKRLEEEICANLKFSFREDHFLHLASSSEEGDFQWWVDPLDGRRNFIHRVPHFCNAIGICFRNVPIASVIYNPSSKDIYHAIRGEGAFKNQKRIFVSKVEKLEYAITASGLPYEDQRKAALSEILSNISVFINSGTGLRRSGSAILDICWIAEGLFDAFWERSFKIHDLCAILIMIEEAGGQLSNFLGKKVEISTNAIFTFDILASNQILHTDLLKLMKQVRNMEGIN